MRPSVFSYPVPRQGEDTGDTTNWETLVTIWLILKKETNKNKRDTGLEEITNAMVTALKGLGHAVLGNFVLFC